VAPSAPRSPQPPEIEGSIASCAPPCCKT